ncbi:hypothetical protein ACIP5Y_01360 [Nocardia sp. NPDC088792]|uniref:hypothetical protein n=1 Tax=Nocardia sp. NPDC088792 TaxID=3364332 RepID=UPI00381DF2DE
MPRDLNQRPLSPILDRAALIDAGFDGEAAESEAATRMVVAVTPSQSWLPALTER